jgi:hypothetical protein
MKTSITLWECPPLRARITRAQCEHNRARAASSDWRGTLSKLDDVPHGPAECLRCPGIDWWARTRPPREVQPGEILREHLEKEALRCKLSGRRESPPPQAAHPRQRRRIERSTGPLLASD